MWLLDTRTLELHEFFGNKIPSYAILSHVWGAEEVSFVEMKKPKHRESARKKIGFSKIERCCAQALGAGHEWAWIDSCCIDKRSSAELSEAINSMYSWYANSDCCYVYLADVSARGNFREELKNSGWFTRGWTLQELLGPCELSMALAAQYLRGEIDRLPSYADFTGELSIITGIAADILSGEKYVSQACISQRMFWASHRETTRPEDRAYSLLGLFDISMPILCGEGLRKAFLRLSHEIISKSVHATIFAWNAGRFTHRLLADSPDEFRGSCSVVKRDYSRGRNSWIKDEVSMIMYHPMPELQSPFLMTNIGLRVTLPLVVGVPADAHNTFESDHTTYGMEGNAKAILSYGLDGQNYNTAITLDLTYVADASDGCPIFKVFRNNGWRRWTVL
ncbi:heterokaryon incompatibility protein-domain-containing protein [Coniochaeta sp. 2T2.1]|nr:heterokaryon incompatibility protein-domain-containing protein [Coniochaeta sp. 2T2.1]